MYKKTLNICCCLASFLIPSIVFLIVLSKNDILPFGNNTLLMVDLQGQYIAMFNYMRSIFSGNNDFVYTLTKSLGGDMVSILTYYLFSPFNIIYLFFDGSSLPLAISIVTTLKIGACGLSFYLLANYLYKNPFSSLIFAISYALSAYVIVYHSNIMWIDGVIFFPLVILGIKLMFEKKKPLVYVIFISLAIMSNYYIGFMICIGAVLFFLFELYRKKRENSETSRLLRVFFEGSVLAGMLSSIAWLTAIAAMVGSKTQLGTGYIGNFTLIIDVNNAINNFTSGSYRGMDDIIAGAPLIFSGCIMLYLVIIYFANLKISSQEKTCAAYVLIFLVFAFTVQLLNNLMHGGSAPVWFPHRFAFLFSFFIIYLAARSFNKLDGFSTFHVVIITGFIVLQFIMNKWGNQDNLLGTEIIIFIIFSLLLLFQSKLNNAWSKYITIGVLLTLNTIDMTQNTNQIISKNVEENNYLAYEKCEDPSKESCTNSNVNYKSDFDEIKPLIDYVKDYDTSDYQYRMEKTFYRNGSYNRANNDAMMFDYAGLSHYSSSDKLDVRNYMSQRMGFHSNQNWTSYGLGSTLAANSLLNVKYIIDRDVFYNSSLIPNRHFGARDHIDLLKTVEATDISKGNYYIYENPYAVGMGFMVKPSSVTYGRQGEFVLDSEGNNVKDSAGNDLIHWFNIFEYQNYMYKDLASLALDDNVQDKYYQDILKPAIVDVTYTNLEPVPDKPNNYKLVTMGAPGTITYVVKFDENNNYPYYYHFRNFYDGQMSFSVPNYGSYYNRALNPIDRGSSNTRTFTVVLNSNIYWETVDVTCNFYYEDISALKEYTDNLKENSLQLRKITSSHYKGEVKYSAKKTMLMVSFPIENNFVVRVNNKKVPTRIIQNIFLGADLSNYGFVDGQVLNIDIRYTNNNYIYTTLLGLVAIAYISSSWYHLDATIKKYLNRSKKKEEPEAIS